MDHETSSNEAGSLTRRQLIKAAAGALLLLPVLGQEAGAAPPQWTAVGKATDFATGVPKRVALADGGVLYVTRIAGAKMVAVSARCTHHGCEIGWDQSAKDFACPCHGSVFAVDGKNLRGTRRSPDQALPPLTTLPARQRAGGVEVDLGSIVPATITPKKDD